MTILQQLENFLQENIHTVTAAQFRGILQGNNIPYLEGRSETDDEEEYIFELVDYPDTWFVFENKNDQFCGIALFES